MANLIKGVESTAETVLPFERDEFHAYIRTNIVRIDEPDTEEMPGKHCWQYDEEVLNTFLEKQAQLFSEEVAQTPEAAEEFLEDCMAVVCEDIHEVRDYFEDAGSDISGMSDDELLDQSEVFSMPSGRFLIVEG